MPDHEVDQSHDDDAPRRPLTIDDIDPPIGEDAAPADGVQQFQMTTWADAEVTHAEPGDPT